MPIELMLKFNYITSKGEVRIGGSAFRLYTIVILTSPVKHRSGLPTRASLRIRTDGLIIQNAHKKRLLSASYRHVFAEMFITGIFYYLHYKKAIV